MDKYEKSIGLKTIYLTLVRQFRLILIIFIPLALASFIGTRLMSKTYISSATISKSSNWNSAQNESLKLQFTNEDNLNAVSEKLKNNNNIDISASSIKNSLSFSVNTSSIYFNCSFQSSNSGLVQPVLDSLVTYVVEKVNTTESIKSSIGSSLMISSPASSASKNSKENRYFLIAMAASVVLALGIPFVYEIVSDELYDKEDIAQFGYEGFEVKATNY